MVLYKKCNILFLLLVSFCSITDTFEGFTLNLLSSLMISGPNSPFYKALIEPEIGSDYSSVVGCVRMGFKALKPAKLFCGIKTIPSKETIFLFSVAVQSVLLVNARV